MSRKNVPEIFVFLGDAPRFFINKGTRPPSPPPFRRPCWVQNNFRCALLLPSREENISSLAAAVQHNFRRTQLLPFREDNINSLAAAVQHNFRRTLLVPSMEENIKRISIAWARAPRYSQARSQAKIPEGAKSLTLKSTRQGSNDSELLYPKYTGCKAKRHRVKSDPQRVKLHLLHPPGYWPDSWLLTTQNLS